MVLQFWPRWWGNKAGAARPKLRADNDPGRSSRPRLEALESRWLPAPCVPSLAGAFPGGVLVAAGHVGLVRAGSASAPKGGTTAGAATKVDVTVLMNSADSVYDLSSVLAGWEGWGYQSPPKIAVVRNTNRALVATRLTDNELRLSYTAGMSGTACVTVGLTDAAGMSAQITFDITVLPGPLVGVAQLTSLKLPSAANPLAR
jgi:hypothetical protein